MSVFCLSLRLAILLLQSVKCRHNVCTELLRLSRLANPKCATGYALFRKTINIFNTVESLDVQETTSPT